MQGLHEDAALTLREAWRRFHLSSDHSPRYVEDAEKALDHWERCSGNPSIGQITNQTMHEWKNAFMGTPLPARSSKSTRKPQKPSNATCAKVLRTLTAILATLGPPQHGNRYGRGIISRIPCARPPKVDEPDVVTATAEELSRIYDACAVAIWPWGPERSPAWWRALLVYLYNIGSRRNDFLELRRSQIDFPRHCIRDRQEKSGKSALKPMNVTLIQHLQAIWHPERVRVFECPDSKYLYRTWYAIQRAAGISVDRPEGSNRMPFYGFHELRKTCGTELWLIDPNAAKQMLGHSSASTTAMHYVQKAKLAERMRPAADAMPQPAAFSGLNQTPPIPPRPTPPPPRPALRVVG